MKRGGITRFKYHLAHKDPQNKTKECPRVPLEVKEEIREILHENTKAKAKKIANIEEICAQLHGIMGARHRHVMDEDNDDDEVEEVYMYPAICTQMSRMLIKMQFVHLR